MELSEKIQRAFEFVKNYSVIESNLTMLRNDAANIFADTYEEYTAIWEAFTKDDLKVVN